MNFLRIRPHQTSDFSLFTLDPPPSQQKGKKKLKNKQLICEAEDSESPAITQVLASIHQVEHDNPKRKGLTLRKPKPSTIRRQEIFAHCASEDPNIYGWEEQERTDPASSKSTPQKSPGLLAGLRNNTSFPVSPAKMQRTPEHYKSVKLDNSAETVNSKTAGSTRSFLSNFTTPKSRHRERAATPSSAFAASSVSVHSTPFQSCARREHSPAITPSHSTSYFSTRLKRTAQPPKSIHTFASSLNNQQAASSASACCESNSPGSTCCDSCPNQNHCLGRCVENCKDTVFSKGSRSSMISHSRQTSWTAPPPIPCVAHHSDFQLGHSMQCRLHCQEVESPISSLAPKSHSKTLVPALPSPPGTQRFGLPKETRPITGSKSTDRETALLNAQVGPQVKPPAKKFESQRLLSPSDVKSARDCVVTDEFGKAIRFGELIERSGPTVVVFIQQFWCRLCQIYVSHLTSHFTNARNSLNLRRLASGNVKVVIIGNGSHSMIAKYRELTHSVFPIYTDESAHKKLYRALGMTLSPLGDRSTMGRGSYLGGDLNDASTTQHATEGTTDQLLMPGNPGHLRQLGGEFVFKATSNRERIGKEVSDGPKDMISSQEELVIGMKYAHRMKNTSDHGSVPVLLAAAGVKIEATPQE